MRTLLVAILASFLALTTVQSAQAAEPFAVTASTTTPQISLGQSFTLVGGAYPKAPGKVVRVQQLVGETWTTIQSPTLGKTGYYSVSIKPTETGESRYRVYKGASDGRTQGFSPVVTVTTTAQQPFAVTASVKDSETGEDLAVVPSGGTFTIVGGVYPKTPGKIVRIQQLDFETNTWSTIQSPVLGRTGYYSATIAPEDGVAQYRVYKGGSDGRTQAVSRSIAAFTGNGG